MIPKVLKLLVLIVPNFFPCLGKSYDNYSLYLANPENVEHVRFLQDALVHRYMDVRFWNYPNNRNVLLLVNKNDLAIFQERVTHFHLKNKLVMENVQSAFDSQKFNATPLDQYINKYEYSRSLKDIYKWLDEVQYHFPDKVTLEVVGQSYENRSILAVAINRIPDAPCVFVEAGLHGSEWLSISFATFLIDQVLTNSFRAIARLRNKYNWFIVPVANPDGYVYTHEKDRLWRKNRRVTKGKSVGVDLNRNFGFRFGEHDSSPDNDDENYRGPEEFSEPETLALKHYIRRNRDNLLFYFSFQGFGQKFILPYSNSPKHQDNFDDANAFAIEAIAKIKAYSGRKYYSGTAFEMLGARYSGDSASWVKHTLRVPYVYTIHMRDFGYYGYALPSKQTQPACREMMIGMTELLKGRPVHLEARVYDRYSENSSSNLLSKCLPGTYFFVILSLIPIYSSI